MSSKSFVPADTDLESLLTAEQQLMELERIMIRRAQLYLEIKGEENFILDKTAQISVLRVTMLKEQEPYVIFFQSDLRTGQRRKSFRIPREFLFSANSTEEEKEMKEYRRLQAKFG